MAHHHNLCAKKPDHAQTPKYFLKSTIFWGKLVFHKYISHTEIIWTKSTEQFSATFHQLCLAISVAMLLIRNPY